jgi:hypothetical protein
VLVKVKHPDQKKHQEQASETTAQGNLLRDQVDRVREQMQQGDAQYDP